MKTLITLLESVATEKMKTRHDTKATNSMKETRYDYETHFDDGTFSEITIELGLSIHSPGKIE